MDDDDIIGEDGDTGLDNSNDTCQLMCHSVVYFYDYLQLLK